MNNVIDSRISGVLTNTALRVRSGLGLFKEDVALKKIATVEAVFGLGIMVRPVRVVLIDGRAIDFYVEDVDRFLREVNAARTAISKRH